jgi:membrane-associated phospholipid phosphatase
MPMASSFRHSGADFFRVSASVSASFSASSSSARSSSASVVSSMVRPYNVAYPPRSVRTRTRHTSDLYIAAAGLLVLVVCGLFAAAGVPDWEADTFHAINDLPQWLYKPLWPFQQLGNLLVGPAVAIVAFALRRHRLALAAISATIGKLIVERIVKLVVQRERPGTSIGDVIMRGDVHPTGESFVSGHAILAFALAAIIAPYLHGRWKLVPWTLAAMNGFARIYVGAHGPLDIIGGSGLGLALGSLLKYAFALGYDDARVHASKSSSSDASPARTA